MFDKYSQDKLREKDDEIRFLQLELEALLAKSLSPEEEERIITRIDEIQTVLRVNLPIRIA